MQVVLQDRHALRHLAEEENAVVGSSKLRQDAVEQLKLPCNSVQLRTAAQGKGMKGVCTYVNVCMHACMCVCVRACVRVCVCASTYIPGIPSGGQSKVF